MHPDAILRARRRAAKKSVSQERSKVPEQLILMLAGFLLTGVVGTWLTNCWAARQWENQQAYLKEQRLIDRKLQLLEQVATEVASTNVAASDVITIEVWGWDSAKRSKEIKEREIQWITASRRWRIQSRILLLDLSVHFKDSKAVDLFRSVINKRRQLGQKIRALLEARHRRVAPKAEEVLVAESNDLVNKLDELSIQIGEVLGEELRSSDSTPRSCWGGRIGWLCS
ncbi:MAG TPA: hypothetical protein VH988_23220 [Thermoanaerobaculia bacterium]|jgi:hypothetical protein|nr:hypothetical protein [Thermoanaerobaculia bacterium]